jgi:hypothetical protein
MCYTPPATVAHPIAIGALEARAGREVRVSDTVVCAPGERISAGESGERSTVDIILRGGVIRPRHGHQAALCRTQRRGGTADRSDGAILYSSVRRRPGRGSDHRRGRPDTSRGMDPFSPRLSPWSAATWARASQQTRSAGRCSSRSRSPLDARGSGALLASTSCARRSSRTRIWAGSDPPTGGRDFPAVVAYDAPGAVCTIGFAICPEHVR